MRMSLEGAAHLVFLGSFSTSKYLWVALGSSVSNTIRCCCGSELSDYLLDRPDNPDKCYITFWEMTRR